MVTAAKLLPPGYSAERFCVLKWSKQNAAPPFCNVRVFVDLGLLNSLLVIGGRELSPTLLTICALYGMDESDDVQIVDTDGCQVEAVNGLLPLTRGNIYEVIAGASTCSKIHATYRIKELYHAIGDDQIRLLSREFYSGVFSDIKTPHFRGIFTERVDEVSAARNQGDWFVEMFGITSHNSKGSESQTPTPYSDQHGEGLVPLMLSKHPAHVMAFANAARWLHHMRNAIMSVLGGGTKTALSVQRYLLRFLAFCEYSAEQRKALGEICMADTQACHLPGNLVLTPRL
jgi:truncated hemoglobin YjbI